MRRRTGVRTLARLIALRSVVIGAVILALGAAGLLLLTVASDQGTVSGHVYSCGSAYSVTVACNPGKPVAHIGLVFETPDGRHSFLTQTDSSGAYSIRIPPGQYKVKDWPVSSISVLPRQHVALDLTSHYLAICLAAQDTIASPTGSMVVSQVTTGMLVWTLDEAGKRVEEPVILVRHTRAPVGHLMVRLALADGRTLEASPGHPTSDSRHVGALQAGDMLDGSRIVKIEFMPYVGDTWDLLPAGSTGVYWVDGVLLKSTLSSDGARTPK